MAEQPTLPLTEQPPLVGDPEMLARLRASLSRLFRCRRHLVKEIAAIIVEPVGYSDKGKFFL